LAGAAFFAAGFLAGAFFAGAFFAAAIYANLRAGPMKRARVKSEDLPGATSR
jgi:hypothetical protein